MCDIKKSPYAEWLEKMCESVMELQPAKIGVCMIADGGVLTAYFGDCSPQDKAVIAYHHNIDAVYDTVRANAADIVAAAEKQEEEHEHDD